MGVSFYFFLKYAELCFFLMIDWFVIIMYDGDQNYNTWYRQIMRNITIYSIHTRTYTQALLLFRVYLIAFKVQKHQTAWFEDLEAFVVMYFNAVKEVAYGFFNKNAVVNLGILGFINLR